ncbi:MAG: response regulator [Gammaproteobacteria bacterium]|nr:response regulator [Gammaproteobacteria bacterium]MCP5299771.1 response regulator [Chromatiaceae bacterium]
MQAATHLECYEFPDQPGNASGKTLTCIVAEDDGADVLLLCKILGKCQASVRLYRVRDGVELLAFLRTPPHRIRPDLVLLDLSMPLMDGRDALVEIREDPNLAPLPVIVLTTSSSPDDVDFAYRNGANSYITKHPDFDRFLNSIQLLIGYWRDAVQLPRVGA